VTVVDLQRVCEQLKNEELRNSLDSPKVRSKKKGKGRPPWLQKIYTASYHCTYHSKMGDDSSLSASELRQRYHKGGSVPDNELSAQQVSSTRCP